MTHRQQFGQMVKELMGQWGLLDADWIHSYDTAKRRLGQCRFREKVLTFSLPFVDCNTIEVMEDTVRHEIAHALAGPGHGHSNYWRRTAVTVGATPRACATDPRIIRPEGPYKFVCNCNTYYFYRSDPLGSIKICRRCNHRGYVVRNS